MGTYNEIIIHNKKPVTQNLREPVRPVYFVFATSEAEARLLFEYSALMYRTPHDIDDKYDHICVQFIDAPESPRSIEQHRKYFDAKSIQRGVQNRVYPYDHITEKQATRLLAKSNKIIERYEPMLIARFDKIKNKNKKTKWKFAVFSTYRLD